MKLMTPIAGKNSGGRFSFVKSYNATFIDTAGGLKQAGTADFRNNMASFGSQLQCPNVNTQYTPVNLTGKRGSFHGFVTPYVTAGNIFTITVTVDDKVFFELVDWVVPSSGYYALYSALHSAFENTSNHANYEFIDNPLRSHLRGMGEPFTNSLKVEYKCPYVHATLDKKYFVAQYFIEENAAWEQ